MNRDGRPSVPKLLRQYYKEDGRLAIRPFFDYACRKGRYDVKEARYANAFAHYVHVAAMLHPKGKLSRHIQAALAYLTTRNPPEGEVRRFLTEFVMPGCKPDKKGSEGQEASASSAPPASALPDSLQSLLDNETDIEDEGAMVIRSDMRDSEPATGSFDPPQHMAVGKPGDFTAWIKGTFKDVEPAEAGVSRTRFVSPRAMLTCRFLWEQLDRSYQGREPLLGRLLKRIDEQLLDAWTTDPPPDDPFAVDVIVEVAGKEFLTYQAACVVATYVMTTQEGFEERLEAWFSGWANSLSERAARVQKQS